MTVKTEMPISFEHKVHRVYHQHHHHHHYHLHHTLDHHHLHIHNRAIHRTSGSSQDHDHQHHSVPQRSEPATFAIRAQAAITVQEVSSISQQEQHSDPSQQNHEHLYNSIQNHSRGHQLLQASGLTHLIARHNQREQQILAASHAQKSRPTLRSKQRSQIQFFLLSAFAYILSPIDLIPEAIFGIFGILDDLVFLFMCLFCVAIILLYPLFREVRRTMFDKLGFKQKRAITHNKDIKS